MPFLVPVKGKPDRETDESDGCSGEEARRRQTRFRRYPEIRRQPVLAAGPIKVVVQLWRKPRDLRDS